MAEAAFPTRCRRSRSEPGQALVITAISFMVLLSFVGLAVDTGFAYVTQRQEQTATDAAALDASVLLSGTPKVSPAVFARAQQIAEANGYSTSPLLCSATTGASGQYVDVYATPSCSSYTTQLVVKVPPDRALMETLGTCAAGGFAAEWSCDEVDLDYKMPTSIERIFSVPVVDIRVRSIAYNGHALPPPPPHSSGLFTPPVSCNGGGEQELGDTTPNVTWAGSFWRTPNPVQATAGGPWTWTLVYSDEWPLDAYTLAVYNGSTASSGHYFSQGVWVNQANTSPPVSNSPGPDTTNRRAPAPSQVVGAYPASGAKGSFYRVVSSGGLAGTSDWVAQFADGTSMEVNGNWDWGGVSGMVSGGGYVATITFSIPAANVPPGGSIGLSAFMQDGDDCGDTVLFETLTPPAPPLPPPGPIMLDG